jgi:hypothetical protein
MDNLCLTTNLSSVELAAWAQAIGAFVAILASAMVAIGVMSWQHKHDHAMFQQHLQARAKEIKAEQDRRLQVIERVVLHTAVATLGAAEAILQADEDDPELGLTIKVQRDLLNQANLLIPPIPMHEQVSPELVSTIFMIATAGTRMEDYLTRWSAHLAEGCFSMSNAKSAASHMRETTIERKDKLKQIVGRALSKNLAVRSDAKVD